MKRVSLTITSDGRIKLESPYFSVRILLPQRARVRSEKPRANRLFLIHAPHDSVGAEELRVHLSVLQDIIKLFNPADLKFGKPINSELWQQLDQADLIVPLVSPYLFADVRSMELIQRAMRRLSAGDCSIIPVMLRPIGAWPKESCLPELKSLPEDGKSILESPNRDSAWAEVVRGLRSALRNPPLSDAVMHW